MQLFKGCSTAPSTSLSAYRFCSDWSLGTIRFYIQSDTAAAILLLFVTPVAWPIILVAVFKSKRWARLQIPYPTAWDAFFAQREPTFVLVHLNDGNLLGGYWGAHSFAGSFPNDGDIYLEGVYAVDALGRFRKPIADTRGALLRKEQYSYVELFAVTQIEEKPDD
jgi:hypothetical protein